MHTRSNMTIILNHTIMIYRCSCIYDAMIAYYSIGINNSPCHNHCSLTNLGRRRDNSRRMNCLSKLNIRIVGLQSLHNHLTYSIHAYAHNHRRKSCCIMQNWTTATLIHIRIIIHKSLYLDAIGIQYILNHFAVTTCSE